MTFIHVHQDIDECIPLHCGRTGVHWTAVFGSWVLLRSCQRVRSLRWIPSIPLHWKRLYGTSVTTETRLTFITHYLSLSAQLTLQWSPNGNKDWFMWKLLNYNSQLFSLNWEGKFVCVCADVCEAECAIYSSSIFSSDSRGTCAERYHWQSVLGKWWTEHLQRTPQGSRCWCQWYQAPLAGWSLFSGTGNLSHSLSGLRQQTTQACGDTHTLSPSYSHILSCYRQGIYV